ncbi:MAG: hypothetical protein WCX28_04975 [Bacteriovoracaceae bacterium]
MFSSLRYITIVLFFSSLCTAEEHESAATHREIFFQLSDSVMFDVSQKLKAYRSIAMVTRRDSFTSYYQPLFVHGLMSQNIPLFLNTDSTETTLELTVRESSIFHGEAFYQSFLGHRSIERRIVFTITGTLISVQEGKILWSKQFSRTFSDTVRYDQLEQLDYSVPPVTAYVRSELSFFDSIVEPVIVTIASGVAIYLFFTIRS